MRELRKWEPRERDHLCPLREAPPGCDDACCLAAQCCAVAANGMPEVSYDISGWEQVLWVLRHAARRFARSGSRATAVVARCAAARRSPTFPKGCPASFSAACLSFVSCCGWPGLGASTTPARNARGPGADSSGRPSSAAGIQPPDSRTRRHLRNSSCAPERGSSSEVRTPKFTAPRANG